MDKKTLDRINSMTRRNFRAEELYTFPVTLCGNEIDRDGERFSDDALEAMKTLFIGKTFIADHNPTMENQVARIYDTELVTTDTLTSYGEPYKYLKGYVYMVRTEKNADLITEIDAGIKREVSVGCSATVKRCSVCGKNILESVCEHIKGHEYDGKFCHHILENVNDAYELSFVAVPAQSEAGVTKKSFEGVKEMEAKTINQNGGQLPVESQHDLQETNANRTEGQSFPHTSFTPITTQEALDGILAEHDKQFEGWKSPEQVQQELDTLKTAHKAELLKMYREKAVLLAGIPPELAERLAGETEEEILKDAEKLSAFTKANSQRTPSFSAENGEMSGVEKAFYARNPEIKKMN